MSERRSCIRCGSARTLPIVYGLVEMPGLILLDKDEEAEDDVYYGGCVIDDLSVDTYCNDCELRFDQTTPNIYLDIDGVFLNGAGLANHAEGFIKTVVEAYPFTTFWLTTRCQGDASATVRGIARYFDDTTLTLLAMIKPTTWDIAKTEAIDFEHPFMWVDDNLLHGEEKELERHGVRASMHLIDLKREPDALVRLSSLVSDMRAKGGGYVRGELEEDTP